MHTRFVIVGYFSIKRRHIWYYNRSFDVCVSGVRSGAVSCECVCVSCEWASRRSSVVRREAFSFALRFVWDSEVFVSNFEFEFSCRVLKSILEFDFSNSRSRILKSNFEFVFFVSLLYSISRISIFDSSFEFKFLDFSCRICRRNFRCLALFDFSNFVALFDFSKAIVKFDFSNFEFSIRLLDSSPLNLMIRNCRRISNSSWSIRLLERRFELSSKLSFASRILHLSS